MSPTTVQCQTALSKIRSNFGGKAVVLGSEMQAPVDEKFRTVQPMTEALFPRIRTYSFPGPNMTPAETWTGGHRTPYGLAFAPDGKLWEVEHGPEAATSST
jgi:glucose/arabinose dehydrogenase